MVDTSETSPPYSVRTKIKYTQVSKQDRTLEAHKGKQLLDLNS